MPPKGKQPQGSANKVKDDKWNWIVDRDGSQTFGMKNVGVWFVFLSFDLPFSLYPPSIKKMCDPSYPMQKKEKKRKGWMDGWDNLLQKNKSAKVKAEVARIQQQASMAGKSRDVLEKEKEKALRAKAQLEEEKRLKEEAALLKPVQTQKVPFGVDPKTVLCAFFKAGTCEKGNKCKFSHDVNVGRKVEKKNLYSDDREEGNKLTDTMDTWDEEKLRSVVLSKAGNPRTSTDIVCKHFIQAIETQKFGWFWECPNGEACQYRHALPPGFVLKSQRKAAEDAAKANVISLEEFLEVERHKLGSNLTPVTPETFAVWKKTRMDKKQAETDALKKAKDLQSSMGKSSGMSGRDLFQYNPEWFQDEDDEDGSDDWDLEQYRREKEQEDAEEEARAAGRSVDDEPGPEDSEAEDTPSGDRDREKDMYEGGSGGTD
ncbi:hypothetical protein CVT25_007299 [Psilocybe cyanescens]|uniref:C3H1-type domain-containing protein n=1 Tax=Psilocybe cyanescens TaxID=93625 RepID=A0A409XPF4_PSICY|nr:hypothetical protein CVT25_007299 [Psilocybe cyanescens]